MIAVISVDGSRTWQGDELLPLALKPSVGGITSVAVLFTLFVLCLITSRSSSLRYSSFCSSLKMRSYLKPRPVMNWSQLRMWHWRVGFASAVEGKTNNCHISIWISCTKVMKSKQSLPFFFCLRMLHWQLFNWQKK